MSRSGRVTLCLLSVIKGCIATIREQKLAEDTLATLLYAEDVVVDAIVKFPVTGNNTKNVLWAKGVVVEWRDKLHEYSTRWCALSFLAIASNIIEDLTRMINDAKKVEYLTIIEEAIDGLRSVIDSEMQEEDFQVAHRATDGLYKTIEENL